MNYVQYAFPRKKQVALLPFASHIVHMECDTRNLIDSPNLLESKVTLLRIGFCVWEYPPKLVGGLGTYAKNITREFVKLGHDVTVFTLNLET